MSGFNNKPWEYKDKDKNSTSYMVNMDSVLCTMLAIVAMWFWGLLSFLKAELRAKWGLKNH